MSATRTSRKTRTRLAALAAGLAITAGSVAAVAPAASAATPTGTKSLASVLTSDGNQFDSNWYDFDIVTEAVLAVLKAKPTSAVGVLANGNVAVTAFIPNDRAFQVLVADLTGKWLGSEKKVFETVASLGIPTVEKVLLYHVVPGATIDSATALNSDNARLKTAEGGTFKVDVISKKYALVRLIDNDRDDVNPWLVRSKLDINKGNKQIAHGIAFVLRPVNL